MRKTLRVLAGGMVLVACALAAQAQRAAMQPEAVELLQLANRDRAAHGLGRLEWDPALAQAAKQHCVRMAAEGEIAHRYGGEADLTERAGNAGAHFSLIAENIAVGSRPEQIHTAWMHSPGHRANLLNPSIDRVGIAVVYGRGVMFVVADYSQGVRMLTAEQVEATIARLVRAAGMEVVSDARGARAACAVEHGYPRSLDGAMPGFIMRWQGSDLSRLPDDLVKKIDSGAYRRAGVGSCAPQDVQGSFTVYRVAVVLYQQSSTQQIKPYYQ
jgi:hypothetical protein